MLSDAMVETLLIMVAVAMVASWLISNSDIAMALVYLVGAIALFAAPFALLAFFR